MIPKLDKTFYSLPQAAKLLYLTGMPRQFCVGPDRENLFANTKLTDRILTSAEQSAKFKEIHREFPSDSITIISSWPNDQDALATACSLVRHYVTTGTRNIEFVHPTEQFPRDAERLKDLYVLTGIHEKDPDILHHVRRWARSSMGTPRVLVVTTMEPYKWCYDQLGCLPQFLFHAKLPGKSIG